MKERLGRLLGRRARRAAAPGVLPRPTPRGYLLAVIAGVAAAGVAAGQPLHALAAIAAGLLAGGAFYANLSAAAASSLKLARGGALRLPEGSDARLALRLCNPTPLYLEVLVEDRGPLGEEWRGRVGIPPGGCTVTERSVRVVYGSHRLGPVTVRARDPLRLYSLSVRVGGEARLVGLPRPEPPPKVIERLVTLYALGYAPGGVAGRGVTVWGLREYTPWDDARMIDWKSYARSGRLYVKEFEAEASTRLVILLDATPTMARVYRGEPAAAWSAREAYGLAMLAHRLGSEPEVYTLTPSARLIGGRVARGRVEDAAVILAQVDPEEPPADCKARAGVLRRFAGKRGHTLIVYTDACLDRGVASLYAGEAERLAAAGVRVAFAYPGPLLREFSERVAPVLARAARVYVGRWGAALGRSLWRGWRG